MRYALAATALTLVVATASACGGGAPEDASKGDFCKQAAKIRGVKTADDLKEWAKDSEDVGTPKDIKDDEREGFEILIDFAKDVEEDKDGNPKEPDTSDDEDKKLKAFNAYVADKCKDEFGTAPK